MKAYLVTTGALFALLALAHVWRIVAEWPLVTTDLPAMLEAGIGIVAAGLCLWAWRLLRLSVRA
ncbi:MAG TPA: hypothetical protein VJJ54_02570 [Gemmatimonadales bacterium]|nr:hypothetical protein [Gemmatimonadales bacterium]